MEKRRWVRPLAAGFLVLLVTACAGGGGSSSSGSSNSRAVKGPATGAAATAAAPADAGFAGPGQAAASSALPAPPVAAEGSKVIRSGQVGIEVKTGTFDSAFAQVVSLAGEEGGVVTASNASTDGDRIREGTITISVPAANFQATLDRLHRLGTLKSMTVSSQDVSQQYVDLQARLANAESARNAMLALLQKAQTVQEILAVQTQLGQYTQQVEQFKGQIDYYDHATSLYAIQVTLREAGLVAAKPPVDEWGLVAAFWTGLHAFVQTVDGLIVILAVVVPYALVAVAAWIAWRRRHRLLGRSL